MIYYLYGCRDTELLFNSNINNRMIVLTCTNIKTKKGEDKMPKIIDDTYMEIDDEFEQIRQALGMYISRVGTEGALHLIKEVTNNEIDECVNPLALSTKFDIVFDEIEQSYTAIDYSRGIPFDKMVDVCSKKHTSTKFIREGEKMKDQCGRNGKRMPFLNS